ncbi:MAG: lipoprotein-releasing system ATP-binding protein LolD [Balneola sp.]|nr:lipoprotein-releasing system ATP-binding protein LolD [Balneola sp.]
MLNSLLRIANVKKSFEAPENGVVNVLNGVNLEINPKTITSIIGSSGSGKSTLLHIIAGLDKIDSGLVEWQGDDITQWDDEKIATFRNTEMGFIFQFHHLLPEFSAIENVMIPAIIHGKSEKESNRLAKELLDEFELGHRIEHRPNQLSGGEQQRVAMARALINTPSLILADEPTGNLDEKNSSTVLKYLLSLRDRFNVSILMVTHDMSITEDGDFIFEMNDGKLLPI